MISLSVKRMWLPASLLSRTLLLLAVALASTLAISSSAHGAEPFPACTTPTYPDNAFPELGNSKYDSRLGTGQSKAVAYNAYSYGSYDYTATVSFEPVPGGRITFPAQQPLRSGTVNETIPIKFAPGDSAGVIVIRSFEVMGCVQTVTSAAITPVEPTLIVGKARSSFWLGNFRLQSVRFNLGLQLCGDGTMEFGIAYRGRWSWMRAPGCAVTPSRDYRMHGWLSVLIREPSSMDTKPLHQLEITSKRNQRFRRKLTYAFKLNGSTVKLGSFTVVRSKVPRRKGEKIFETDFDDYWNFCVREDREVYSQGGRLYCYLPGSPAYWDTAIRRITQ